MLEIVFTDSACGSLKMAQSFGKGKFHGGCIGVFIHHGDGTEATQAEIDEEIRKAEEKERQKWEQAVPLGGKSSDVFGFPLGLSFGDIHDPLCIRDRLDATKVLFSFWNEQLEMQMRDQMAESAENLEKVRNRISGGEDVRIWYSDIPDELCGFYWLMDELRTLPEGHGTIYAVKQPQYDEIGDTVCSYNGWGEIEPGQFSKFTSLAVPISDRMRRIYGNAWKQLQEENAPIRACINGQLRSAPENLYDHYIRMELDREADEFKEARVVGNVLGRYQLGIGDGYIHYRIEKMVKEGKLIAVTVPKEDDPGYWRILRKSK